MLITEEEAKEKWCPFARMNQRGWSGVAQPKDAPIYCNCIASQCMAWRWADAPPEDDGNVDARGFCGLAGRVE